ncbi:MAG: hypothetical protein H7332_10305 [Bdellovibrionales bacterium]|nr:hypothetical protein [Ramlibacter sp.]
MPKLYALSPGDLLHPADGTLPDFAPYRYKFLAQGDSWFSVGAVPPGGTTSLFRELDLSASCCAVNCAHPGYVLKRMISATRDPNFTQLLAGNQAWKWDGILMSAGGNDLIDAMQVMPHYGNHHPMQGQPIPPDLRLLLRPDEWKPVRGADSYLSDAGWTLFCNHLTALLHELVELRDSRQSLSRGAPLFLHGYDYLLARDAPAGPFAGPWLYPALNAYSIPQRAWQAVGREVINRFNALLRGIELPQLHVVSTPGSLTAAVPGSSGESGDWINEIHPNAEGYRKLARKYSAVVDAQFA